MYSFPKVQLQHFQHCFWENFHLHPVDVCIGTCFFNRFLFLKIIYGYFINSESSASSTAETFPHPHFAALHWELHDFKNFLQSIEIFSLQFNFQAVTHQLFRIQFQISRSWNIFQLLCIDCAFAFSGLYFQKVSNFWNYFIPSSIILASHQLVQQLKTLPHPHLLHLQLSNAWFQEFPKSDEIQSPI